MSASIRKKDILVLQLLITSELHMLFKAWCLNKGTTQHLKHCILTSYIQAIVTGKLCKRGHIVGVVGKVVSLLCNTLCSLQDAVIVGSLK